MDKAEETRGFVFNIQHYSIHDGPGIRTTVFTMGCPLRCIWCQNPESQSLTPQLFFTSEKCAGCGECVSACPQKAIALVDGRSKTDRLLCRGLGKCTAVCPNEARTIMGKGISAADVFRDVNADAVFYDRSGGGITISRGRTAGTAGFYPRRVKAMPAGRPNHGAGYLRLCRMGRV